MMSASPAVGGPNLNVGIFLAAVWARVCILCIIISCRSKPGRRVNPCAHTVMQVFRLVWISYFQTFQVRVSFCILQEVVLRTGFWATGPFMLGVEPVTTAEPFSLFFLLFFLLLLLLLLFLQALCSAFERCLHSKWNSKRDDFTICLDAESNWCWQCKIKYLWGSSVVPTSWDISHCWYLFRDNLL